MLRMGRASIRHARPEDCADPARLRHALWPESSQEEHKRELTGLLAGRPAGNMPLEVLVAQTADGSIAGLVEAGLRSHAEGCDESRAVGYLQGWFVDAPYRRRGIGAALLRAAEDWARNQGCRETASDASLENKISQWVHEVLGSTEAGRAVNYRRLL